MTRPGRLAFIGNSLPRRCGIATFTTDLQQAVSARRFELETVIVAMTDRDGPYDYPAPVHFEIEQGRIGDYVRGADVLDAGSFDVVSLQHEFGIFGGEAGAHVLTLLERLTMPVVTTLHTVLAAPSPAQRAVMDRLVAGSARVVVMAEKGRELLRSVYGVPAAKIDVIPHGIPDVAFCEPDEAKAELGFSGRSVILTFGLLSPNKGVEVMIDAMPAILETTPDAVYVVLGATHPNLVRDEGEAYRERLQARVAALGIERSVVFLDRFVDRATLLRFIAMCDVYVTPYLDAAQMTSGTLAYSFGLGKAVVSTPYWHARELLADGRGILVPFGDAATTGRVIAGLLTDPVRRDAMRRHAYDTSRSMTWERTADRYLALFEEVRREHRLRAVEPPRPVAAPVARVLPALRVAHFLTMCDDTGLFQHAVHAVPDRAHGYCVDDNARALILACRLEAPGEQSLPEGTAMRFAAFVQHAWNPDIRRFRNFMGFDRHWLEPQGSEDSHGRTLWALGECSRGGPPSRRRWAHDLFAAAAPTVEGFTSPRAWAFALLGLDGWCADDDAPWADRLRALLADRLISALAAAEAVGRPWFEAGLAYDNARLCEALIVSGRAARVPAWTAAGLRSLRWLVVEQTAPSGVFRPAGSHGFHDVGQPPRRFDQQPLEATATIAACLAARSVDDDPSWRTEADRAFAWFLGENDLSIPLIDLETGGCRDGLHPDRANENRGGESVVSWLMGLIQIRSAARAGALRSPTPPLRAVGA